MFTVAIDWDIYVHSILRINWRISKLHYLMGNELLKPLIGK